MTSQNSPNFRTSHNYDNSNSSYLKGLLMPCMIADVAEGPVASSPAASLNHYND